MRFLSSTLSTLSVAGVGAALALTAAAPAPAQAQAGVPALQPLRALYDVGVHSDVTRAQADAAALSATTFKQYKATVKVGTKRYTYVMAGKNPAKKVADPAATVKMELVPLIMKFSNGDTWDPTKTDSCDTGASPLARVQNSPLVVKQNVTWGGTSIGKVQLTDAFQRAEFWKDAKPGGINPGYNVNMSWTTVSPVTVNVPAADAVTRSTDCGNGLLGEADLDWLESYVQSKVIPSLGIGPRTIPVLLLHNFVEYIGSTSDCCELGYHAAYTTSAGVQTYALGVYNNSDAFGSSIIDISTLTHELAEWQNDPYWTNPTPPWGHTGQVSGCQSTLEVGDPLSWTVYTDRFDRFTYHPQELAFFSWFYHQSPSQGVNGWYSDQDTFTKYAAKC